MNSAAATRPNGPNDRTSSLELSLEQPGTLPPPGPIGRLVRLGWGALLAYASHSVWTGRDALAGASFPIQPAWWVGTLALLSAFPYVVNIGFGVAWNAWPRRVVIGVVVAWAATNVAFGGSVWSAGLGRFVIGWQLYSMAHLGISFVLAAAIGTPGCEMRALPHLWTVLTGRQTQEHYCPGHIDAVDRWERARTSGGHAAGPQSPLPPRRSK